MITPLFDTLLDFVDEFLHPSDTEHAQWLMNGYFTTLVPSALYFYWLLRHEGGGAWEHDFFYGWLLSQILLIGWYGDQRERLTQNCVVPFCRKHCPPLPEDVEVFRASGDVVCPLCEKHYYEKQT